VKLLFDQNISFRLINKLNDIYPDSGQVTSLNLVDSSDIDIWKYAKDNEYTVVTFDSDFYDLSLVWGHPPKIIWIRSSNQTTQEVEKIVRAHSDNIREFVSSPDLACLEIINKS